MRGLRVLITNNSLGNRAGSELYVRDLATALLKRGHSPVAFSTNLGEVAHELRAATIPVIDNLDALATPPDIIHGQHHIETMMALLRFPSTPAIYFCHGWLPWEEAAPRFPRVLRYLAVDDTCRDRLMFENGIPEDSIRVLLNFVELERFKPRGPLPPRPERALIFSNNANEHTHVKAVREACERVGIALDVIGLSSGNVCVKPEKMLGKYDLVFAKGRSALEALAVGAAVVLCDAAGVGPMVTMREIDRLRSLNFGIRALQEPLCEELIAREIARYDATDAADVSQRIRATSSLDAVIDELLSLYKQVIAEYSATSGHDSAAESRAAAEYLRWLAPLLKQNQRLRGERDWIQTEYNVLHASLAASEQEIQSLLAARDQAQSLPAAREQEVQSLLVAKDQAQSLLAKREQESQSSLEARDQLQSLFAACEQVLVILKDNYETERARLEEQITDSRQTVLQLTEELAKKEADFAKLSNSLGWRLLSSYGPIKHGLVLPVFKGLQKLLPGKSR